VTLPYGSLPDFAEAVNRLEGGFKWHAYPHLRFICEHIVRALRRPGGGRLIINIPPRNGKSELLSHYLPVWYLEAAPERKVILTSYGEPMAAKWGRKVRDTFNLSQLHTNVRQDMSSVTRWETEEGGGMISAGLEGSLLGEGFQLGIIDDPHKNWNEAQSRHRLAGIWDWFEGTFQSRAEPDATIVLIQQRLHQADLAGQLLEKQPGEWDVVSLPAIAEANDPMGREEGEALCPERYPIEVLTKWRDGSGEDEGISAPIFDAMQQQKPRAPGGNIVQEEWIQYYEPNQLPAQFDEEIMSWDATFKKTEAGSFVVGQVWGRVGADCYLIDQVRRRMDFTECLDAFKAFVVAHPRAGAKLVEDKANGPAIVSQLKSTVAGLIEHPVGGGSKEARFHAVAPFYRSGNVKIPRNAPWTRTYVAEVSVFPGSERDDQVDASSQAIDYLLLKEAKIELPEDLMIEDLTRPSRHRIR